MPVHVHRCVCDIAPRQLGAEACTLLAICAEVAARQIGSPAREIEFPATPPSSNGVYATPTAGRSQRRTHRSSCDGSSGSSGGATAVASQPAPAPLPVATPATDLPRPPPLLQVKLGLAAGTAPIKRSSFERSGIGVSSTAVSLAGSRASSIGGGSGGNDCFDSAAAAAIAAVTSSMMPCGAPVRRFSINRRGSGSSDGSTVSAAGAGAPSISMTASGMPAKRVATDLHGSNEVRPDMAAEGSIVLYSAALPEVLPLDVATAGGAPINRLPLDRPQLPASGNFRSDTANDMTALYSSLLAAEDSAAAGIKADAVLQQPLTAPQQTGPAPASDVGTNTSPGLPSIPSGAPAPTPSAFATEAAQRSVPDEANIDDKISAAAAMCHSGSGSLASCSLAASYSRPASLDLGAVAAAKRAALLPPPRSQLESSPGHAPTVRPSANTASASASYSRRNSCGASPLGPKPASRQLSLSLASQTSAELIDELSAEFGLLGKNSFGSVHMGWRGKHQL